MLTYINKALEIVGFKISRLEPRSLRYQRASKPLLVAAIVFYTFIGWFGMSFFDISQALGERGAGCALQFVFSEKAVRFFYISGIVMALYLLRQHLKPAENTLGKKYSRMAWAFALLLAFFWVGFFQALGAVVLGVAIYIAQHEFKTSLFFFVFSIMALVVGTLLKIQSPELLWRIRRKSKSSTLIGAIVPPLAILVIVILAQGITEGDWEKKMKPPQSVKCPDPRIIWD